MKMEMIDRYVYGVTKRLPEEQRADIGDEVRGLIEDMLDERVQGRDVTEEDVREVLLELGHPRSLARKYQGNKKYIIGPELYDFYVLIAKIALISTVVGLTAIFLIKVILSPINIIDDFVDYIVSFITTIPMVIGWVTIGFVLAEYFDENKFAQIKLDNNWDPSNLTPIPDPKRQIKRCEPITSIVIYVFVIVMLVFSNEYFGIWIFQQGEFSGIVPFLNEAEYSSFLILILIVCGFGILKECLKLFYERWTYSLVTLTAIVNLVSITIFFYLLNENRFWNPDFMNELVQNGIVTNGSDNYQVIKIIWEQMTLWGLVILVLGLIWDVVTGFIKVRKAR
ncbi:HAAS signaling domain-containing protein [Piscibacillus halophilus]|uniref:HAAS signaling domain-containing protein n=1 Tax=Piscibacillus halophilus TaxID=571933 RepID=UPI001FEBA18B|nr:hypothetical protein [Piscibacillus halophilus]